MSRARLETACTRLERMTIPTISTPTQHGKSFDVVLFHELHNFVERRILRDGAGIGCHNILDLASLLMHEISSGLSWSDENFQPSASLFLRSDLLAPHEIAFRDDADQIASFVDHRESADAVLQHFVCGIHDRGVGCDRNDLTGHNLVRAHL